MARVCTAIHPPVGMRATDGFKSLTTLVHFNNRFGRFYFALIKPFHRLMVKSLLGRL
jgi:hypothetical protein